MNKRIFLSCSLYPDWTEEQEAKWLLQRKQGLLRFMLVEGVLKWGVFSCVIFSIASLKPITLKAEDPWQHFWFTCFVWFIASLCYGFITWKATQYSFNQHEIE